MTAAFQEDILQLIKLIENGEAEYRSYQHCGKKAELKSLS